jgi:hypothetical protein
MNITKDEARILCAALEDSRYELCKHTSKGSNNAAHALNKLLIRLKDGHKDNRRNGRTSMNSFINCMDRFVAKELRDDNKD